jgi:hypothetical protein
MVENNTLCLLRSPIRTAAKRTVQLKKVFTILVAKLEVYSGTTKYLPFV